ncbi:CAP domain-containing protein [Corynebacterium sp. ES2775-CONJ]|uniref:CAP domain-containing protein n=1 Tax=Corynebacterium sp. ES2775-CONJ TaxID=2974029 RepID=UPI002167B931|nr:CAP domain-containing protein [Corynebacterium sp. ES2775-CONJ]MCS4490527.1 CAP domain-containing protein [Corynebacterium sp. ES2775-CONJ]
MTRIPRTLLAITLAGSMIMPGPAHAQMPPLPALSSQGSSTDLIGDFLVHIKRSVDDFLARMSPARPLPPYDQRTDEAVTIALINQERTRRGLYPLVFDDVLYQQARGHSQWMAHNQFQPSVGITSGELIASAPGVLSGQAFHQWNSVPGERALLLNPRLTRIAVAAHRAVDGRILYTALVR